MSTTIIEMLKKKIPEEDFMCINEMESDDDLISTLCPNYFNLKACGDCKNKMCSECWSMAVNTKCLYSKEVLQHMLGYIFGYLHDEKGTDKEVHNALKNENLSVYGIDIGNEFLL